MKIIPVFYSYNEAPSIYTDYPEINENSIDKNLEATDHFWKITILTLIQDLQRHLDMGGCPYYLQGWDGDRKFTEWLNNLNSTEEKL